MSISKQKLTFAQLVPKWSKKLRKGFSNAKRICKVDGQELNLERFDKCIVGEAYNFQKGDEPSTYDVVDTDGYCFRCKSFAYEFDQSIGSIVFYQENENKIKVDAYKKGFKDLQKKFMEHWNEKHVS